MLTKTAQTETEEYRLLVKEWREIQYTKVETNYSTFASEYLSLGKVLSSSPCITWIFDLRSQHFDYISENFREICGYDTLEVQLGALEFINNVTHPDDLGQVWKLRKKLWEHLTALPIDQLKNYRFTYDFRLLRPDGSSIRLLEQNSVLQQDSLGNMTHIMGICSEITHQKQGNILSASITSTIDGSFLTFTSDSGSDLKDTLSCRELQIVRLIANGYSSKLIADQLCISSATVNTHRQNIIRKTKMHNTSGFIQYAICNGLI